MTDITSPEPLEPLDITLRKMNDEVNASIITASSRLFVILVVISSMGYAGYIYGRTTECRINEGLWYSGTCYYPLSMTNQYYLKDGVPYKKDTPITGFMNDEGVYDDIYNVSQVPGLVVNISHKD